jgi:hypothetical protein
LNLVTETLEISRPREDKCNAHAIGVGSLIVVRFSKVPSCSKLSSTPSFLRSTGLQIVYLLKMEALTKNLSGTMQLHCAQAISLLCAVTALLFPWLPASLNNPIAPLPDQLISRVAAAFHLHLAGGALYSVVLVQSWLLVICPPE